MALINSAQPCDSKTELLVIPPANKQPVTFSTIPLDIETHFLNLRFKVWVLSLTDHSSCYSQLSQIKILNIVKNFFLFMTLIK